MKKLSAILSVILMLAVLCTSCGGAGEAPDNTEGPASGTETASGEESEKNDGTAAVTEDASTESSVADDTEKTAYYIGLATGETEMKVVGECFRMDMEGPGMSMTMEAASNGLRWAIGDSFFAVITKDGVNYLDVYLAGGEEDAKEDWYKAPAVEGEDFVNELGMDYFTIEEETLVDPERVPPSVVEYLRTETIDGVAYDVVKITRYSRDETVPMEFICYFNEQTKELTFVTIEIESEQMDEEENPVRDENGAPVLAKLSMKMEFLPSDSELAVEIPAEDTITEQSSEEFSENVLAAQVILFSMMGE